MAWRFVQEFNFSKASLLLYTPFVVWKYEEKLPFPAQPENTWELGQHLMVLSTSCASQLKSKTVLEPTIAPPSSHHVVHGQVIQADLSIRKRLINYLNLGLYNSASLNWPAGCGTNLRGPHCWANLPSVLRIFGSCSCSSCVPIASPVQNWKPVFPLTYQETLLCFLCSYQETLLCFLSLPVTSPVSVLKSNIKLFCQRANNSWF